jgi:phosphoglycolate phosphatase
MFKNGTIIWDWNGTLLNDVDICLYCINNLLNKRGHNSLSRDKYREIFTFPVQDYYVKAGFDFTHEPFDEIAMEFINLYQEKLPGATIFQDVQPVLEYFRDKNFRQVMVSAMEHQSLLKSVKERNILDFFEVVSGIEDHFAVSKMDNARNIINRLDIDPETTWLIGDTCHDFEVASELGIQCILVAIGHQSHARISLSGCLVFRQLIDLIGHFKLNHFEFQNSKTFI